MNQRQRIFKKMNHSRFIFKAGLIYSMNTSQKSGIKLLASSCQSYGIYLSFGVFHHKSNVYFLCHSKPSQDRLTPSKHGLQKNYKNNTCKNVDKKSEKASPLDGKNPQCVKKSSPFGRIIKNHCFSIYLVQNRPKIIAKHFDDDFKTTKKNPGKITFFASSPGRSPGDLAPG